MKRWIIPVLVLLLILLCLNLFFRDHLSAFNGSQKPLIVVIDPGHGGKDPGKVGINDALEKDINLSIALELKKVLEAEGFEVIMTRETDVGLYSESATNKKREDLNARVAIVNGCDAAMMISIHQNSYSQSKVKGAQVFYYDGSENGQKLAETIQIAMAEHVDPNNKRVAKGNDHYFMLKQIKTTGVIVECGFLSNPVEAELLLDRLYQVKVAKGIGAGILEYLKTQ